MLAPSTIFLEKRPKFSPVDIIKGLLIAPGLFAYSGVKHAIYSNLLFYHSAVSQYELSRHDLQSHIFPQIAGFVKALKNESTKRIIKESIYKTVRENRESVKRIKSILSSEEEVYYFLELVLDRGLGVVVVIDRKTPELGEVVDSVSTSMSIESQILEFITYEDDKGKKIHILDSLQTQAAAVKAPSTISKQEPWEVRVSWNLMC